MKIQITQLICKKCNYEWLPRTPVLPKVCPKCKSYKWGEENDKIYKRKD